MSEIASSEGPSVLAPQAEVITVAIIDDNRMVRDALTLLLSRIPGIEVVAGQPTAEGLVALELIPKVILLDLSLEDGDSLGVANDLRREMPNSRVIVMDLLPAQEEVAEFVGVGVAGFILKEATLDTAVRTIRSVAAGADVLPPELAGTLFSEIARQAVFRTEVDRADSVRITSREREVIDLISEGLSNKEIGRRLYISTHTVKSHLRNIMEKLTLHSRLQIAAYAHAQDKEE